MPQSSRANLIKSSVFRGCSDIHPTLYTGFTINLSLYIPWYLFGSWLCNQSINPAQKEASRLLRLRYNSSRNIHKHAGFQMPDHFYIRYICSFSRAWNWVYEAINHASKIYLTHQISADSGSQRPLKASCTANRPLPGCYGYSQYTRKCPEFGGTIKCIHKFEKYRLIHFRRENYQHILMTCIRKWVMWHLKWQKQTCVLYLPINLLIT